MWHHSASVGLPWKFDSQRLPTNHDLGLIKMCKPIIINVKYSETVVGWTASYFVKLYVLILLCNPNPLIVNLIRFKMVYTS